MSVAQRELEKPVAAPPQRDSSRTPSAIAPYKPLLLGVAGSLGFLLIWQVFSAIGPVSSHYLPPPTVVFAEFVENLSDPDFWTSVGYTLRAWLIGLVVSSVAAIAVGVIIGSGTFLRRATHSTIEFLRPIPAVALIPLAALLYGPALSAELLIVVYACFWIVLVQVLYGVADVDKVATDTALTLQMNFWQRVRYLLFPTLLPFLMTGVRLAATVALILSVGVELIIGTPGLGQDVALAQINDDAPAMFALIVTSGILGMLVNWLMGTIERKVLFWHASVRGGVKS
ncbi:ABC transporter permease [Rhodococcus zopfii]|uniref:ABC transporter permease n=1 Tax=Rhodococcus zopfii TaxID=43772 RepID=UPI0011115875|nr:ABC transporter permease [Rhodococcus zopfii]